MYANVHVTSFNLLTLPASNPGHCVLFAQFSPQQELDNAVCGAAQLPLRSSPHRGPNHVDELGLTLARPGHIRTTGRQVISRQLYQGRACTAHLPMNIRWQSLIELPLSAKILRVCFLLWNALPAWRVGYIQILHLRKDGARQGQLGLSANGRGGASHRWNRPRSAAAACVAPRNLRR